MTCGVDNHSNGGTVDELLVVEAVSTVGRMVSSSAERVIVVNGGIILCSGNMTAEVGSPVSTVTDQKSIAVVMNVGIVMIVTLVTVWPFDDESTDVVIGGQVNVAVVPRMKGGRTKVQGG